MKTFKLFSMAALALAMAACSNEDNILENVTPAQQGTMHFTATVAAPGSGAMTRTIYSESSGTINVAWKAGDLIYLLDEKNGATCIAAVGTPTADGSATISGTFNQPVGVGDNITAYYPVSAVIDASDVISQEGTLAFIQDKLDCRMGTSTISVSGTEATLATALQMKSQIAIWKLTLQNSSSEALSATKVTVKDGSDEVLGRTKDISATSVVYLALSLPAGDVKNADITIEATVGSDTYSYSKSGVSLAKGKYYQSTVTMKKKKTITLSTIASDYTAQDYEVLTGTLANKVKISIADGAIVTLKDMNINGSGTYKDGLSAGITCEGDATIILEGTNTVKGLGQAYPGIYVPEGKTLTIMGSGKLTASSGEDGKDNMFGAGIGGGAAGSNNNCGNIVIKGGTIDATGGVKPGGTGAGIGGSLGSCGNITISGGYVTAKGGYSSAGIGGGSFGDCGNITISGGTVDATGGGGYEGGAGIGSGFGTSCGNITISGGTITAKGGTNTSNDAPAAGIGGGYANEACGVITITSGVTSVTATKGGGDGAQSIGKGKDGADITVDIEDGANVTQN